MSRHHEMNMRIADLMIKYGGSFVQQLGELIKRADPINILKLREVFPDYFNQYHPSQWLGKEKDE